MYFFILRIVRIFTPSETRSLVINNIIDYLPLLGEINLYARPRYLSKKLTLLLDDLYARYSSRNPMGSLNWPTYTVCR